MTRLFFHPAQAGLSCDMDIRPLVRPAGQIVPPIAASRVVKQLQDAGYDAYFVGGCVRDSLMGRVPKDWDIATSALPEQIMKVFPRKFQMNNKFGTVTVQMTETIIRIGTPDSECSSEVYLARDITFRKGGLHVGIVLRCLRHIAQEDWVEGRDASTRDPDPEGDRMAEYIARKHGRKHNDKADSRMRQ